MSALRRADARAIVGRLADDPEWYARTILGHDPWEMPCAIGRALSVPRARVAVKACHSSGKTHSAAEWVLWWVSRGGIAVTTAPTWTQVERLLWGEIHRAYQGARFPLGGRLLQTQLQMGPQNYAVGLSTNEGVNFQGWHGDVLIVLDEAPGVRPDIYEAIEGIRAGGDVRLLLLGNPTIASGPFHDAFTRARSGWVGFTIDAFATPNFYGLYPPGTDPAGLSDEAAIAPLLAMTDEGLDTNPRPYLTTRRWVLEKWHEWGPESPLWQARVRGRFPKQSEDALLSLAWLEAAGARQIPATADDEWVAGIDVAGPGEAETVLAIRRGPTLVKTRAWASPDPRGEVLAELAPLTRQLARVNVDSVGQGYYFARHLADAGHPVADINVGEASNDHEKYVNWKAELYWSLRMRLAAGDLAGLTDEPTVGQLAGIRYRHDARGRVAIEGKDEARRRGVPSPDRAEALMLCYAPPRPVADATVTVFSYRGARR